MSFLINAAGEGYPDEVVIKALCGCIGIEVAAYFNAQGKAHLDRKVSGYNKAAKRWHWLVLRDLDGDAECAPDLRHLLLPEPEKLMEFRIVVRAIEAWLLADRSSLAKFFRVSEKRVPLDPEQLVDPKGAMIQLCSLSRRRDLKEDMLPRRGSGARVGPAYASRLAEFAEKEWRPRVAAKSSDSLHRCIKRLDAWVAKC
jgi:hypothetical protein